MDIATHTFTFREDTIDCVGTKRAINDLINYFRLHLEKGINIRIFLKRIVDNHVYAYASKDQRRKSKSPTSLLINEYLRKNGLLMDPKTYYDAMFLYQPEVVSKAVGVPIDELNKNLSDYWLSKFGEVNSDEEKK